MSAVFAFALAELVFLALELLGAICGVLYVCGQRADVPEHCSCCGRKLSCRSILHEQSRLEKSRRRRSRGARSRRQMSSVDTVGYGAVVQVRSVTCRQPGENGFADEVSRRANCIAGWTRNGRKRIDGRYQAAPTEVVCRSQMW